MGVFAALIFPTTLSIISNTFPDRKQRAAALGGWGAVVGMGVALGPVTGGLLLEHFYWGSVFLALAPLALVAAGLAFFLVPESRDPSVPALDKTGLGISVAMLSLLTWTIIEAPERGWGSAGDARRASPLTAVLIGIFVAVERRAEHPMLDVRLFTDRRFSAASGAVMITFFSLAGFIFLITQYFQLVRGYSPLSTGARIIPVAVSIAVASVAGGLLAPRVGHPLGGHDRAGDVRRGDGLDLDGRRRHAVRHHDRRADGPDGPGHGADLHARRPSRSCSSSHRPVPASGRP